MSRDVTGKMQASVEILQSIIAEEHKRREADRRTMRALLHELEQMVTRAEELVPNMADVNKALSSSNAGRLLKLRRMAAQVDLHPETLRILADRGRVPGVQLVEDGDWHFDPEEVIPAIKQQGRAWTNEARERAAAEPGKSTSDAQIEKEMEQGL